MGESKKYPVLFGKTYYTNNDSIHLKNISILNAESFEQIDALMNSELLRMASAPRKIKIVKSMEAKP